MLSRSHLMIIFITLQIVQFSHGSDFKVTQQIFFDINHGDKELGRIIIGLFGDIAPKTIKNFVRIATVGVNGKTYAGSSFHRVIPRFMIQGWRLKCDVLGGDILYSNGTGSISIYGKYFKDENFDVKHTDAGFVSMANAGKDTNGCQFFITTTATPWLDGHHTIFGKVVEGQDIVHKIELVKTNTDDCPVKSVYITKSGIIETPYPFYISDERYDLWAWLRASALPLGMSFSILGFFHWVMMRLPS